MKKSFAERLQEAMDMRNMKAYQLAEKTGLSRPSISKYLHGIVEATQTPLYKLAIALDVSEAWLMGYDVAPERIPRAQSITIQTVPLLGEIACGQPIMANENFEAYVSVGARIPCDFCLRAKGDSMVGARINDGDIVFIRRQPLVNNGEIAAVEIDGEATLKRVYLEEGRLVLVAENPSFPPLIYVGEELNSIRIMGKAVAFQSDLR